MHTRNITRNIPGEQIEKISNFLLHSSWIHLRKNVLLPAFNPSVSTNFSGAQFCSFPTLPNEITSNTKLFSVHSFIEWETLQPLNWNRLIIWNCKTSPWNYSIHIGDVVNYKAWCCHPCSFSLDFHWIDVRFFIRFLFQFLWAKPICFLFPVFHIHTIDASRLFLGTFPVSVHTQPTTDCCCIRMVDCVWLVMKWNTRLKIVRSIKAYVMNIMPSYVLMVMGFDW